MGVASASKNIFDAVFKDKDGHVVIWQFPNAPLWVWAVAWVLDVSFSKYAFHVVFGSISTAALLLWAGMEIVWGKSLFRRILGGVVLVGLVAGFVGHLSQ